MTTERIILISDRATKAEQKSVAVHIDPSKYVSAAEPAEETFLTLRTAKAVGFLLR